MPERQGEHRHSPEELDPFLRKGGAPLRGSFSVYKKLVLPYPYHTAEGKICLKLDDFFFLLLNCQRPPRFSSWGA
jgi:hypothetical protein